LLCSHGPIEGAKLTVCKTGCNYTTIGTAISSANPLDRISVEEGNYRENLKVDKELIIQGTGRGNVTLKPNTEGKPIITIGPGKVEVTIRQLTVTGSRGSPADRDEKILPDGISVRGQANLKLEEVIVANNDSCGIRLLDNSALVATNSSFSYNGNACCASGDSRLKLVDTRISGNGIVLSSSSSASVTESTISNHNEKGIELEDGSYLEIINSKIGTCETCIFLSGDSFLSMVNSSVEDAGDGIKLIENSSISIKNSVLTGSTSGVELEETATATVSDSRIKENDHGFSLLGKADLKLRNCRVAYNDIGIRVNPGANVKVSGCDVRFYNNFEGHTKGIPDVVENRMQDRCKD
jgi:parallel beta-helix repeat protein